MFENNFTTKLSLYPPDVKANYTNFDDLLNVNEPTSFSIHIGHVLLTVPVLATALLFLIWYKARKG
jgi:hypothetical protein